MNAISIEEARRAVRELLPEAARLLSDLIRIPSTPGQELQAMTFLQERFNAVQGLRVEKVPLSDNIRSDPDYCDPVPGLKYDGRFNLRLVRKGTGRGRNLLFNAHVDVVPPSEGMENPWSGRRQGKVIFGRGACDAKGQVVTLFLALRALDALGARTGGDVLAHLVVEEENGGNGTLAMIRRGETADGCVVMEPSENCVFTSIRGAVWFRLALRGKAGHVGNVRQTCSALLLARDAMAVLERYHAELLKRSRGLPLFAHFPNPMPLTFGKLQSGNWPATVPGRATIEGVLGFLPNMTNARVCKEMRQALVQAGGHLAGKFNLGFMYRHDSSVLDPAHELPSLLLRSGAEAGLALKVGAMTSSCDAWFYNNQLRIPTVAYGPGTLKMAHSKDEQINMDDIAAAAETLVHLIVAYCRPRSCR